MNDDAGTTPIGTRGRAGRGGPGSSPSAAARLLAGKQAATKPATLAKPAKRPPADETSAAPSSRTERARRLHAVTDDDADEAAREATGASGDVPGGIPVDEVLTALAEAARRVLGSDWERRLATMLAAVRGRLGGDYSVDEFGLDPQIVEVVASAFEPIAEKWFRLQVRGVENIPADGGALLVANHSGTVPVDGLMTGYAVTKHTDRHLRPLGADLLFSLPFVGQVARKMGATLACADDAERLLRGGELAGVWPEGFKGIGKPFAERYKLQRFGRGGFVSSALRAQVPIVPVSIVGAEEIYPLVGNVPSLARLLGLPYLPITPFFPLLGPLGLVPLPSKWIIEFGEPVRTDAYEPDAADDPMLLFNVTDQVRETIQQTLYRLLVERGNAFI